MKPYFAFYNRIYNAKLSYTCRSSCSDDDENNEDAPFHTTRIVSV